MFFAMLVEPTKPVAIFNPDFGQNDGSIKQTSSYPKHPSDQTLAAQNAAYFISLLRSHGKTFSQGKLIHGHSTRNGYGRDRLFSNLLIEMYGKFFSLDDAWSIFVRIRQRNILSWNIMIRACVLNGETTMSFQLFCEMKQERLIADEFTFTSILKTCSSPTKVQWLHSCILHSALQLGVILGNTLIDMYGKLKSLEDACKVFNRMSEQDVISWNTMISAFTENEYHKEALYLVSLMQLESLVADKVTCINVLTASSNLLNVAAGKWVHAFVLMGKCPYDVVVGTALVNMYAKCMVMEDASSVFERMQDRNVQSWAATISGYAQANCHDQVLCQFQQARLDVLVLEEMSYFHALNACANLEALANGKLVHACVVHTGLELNFVLGNVIVTMYGKCGCAMQACAMFCQISQPTLISWTAMIAAYRRTGKSKEAISLFKQLRLKQMVPDNITLTTIFEACADLQDLAEGKWTHAYTMTNNLNLDITATNSLLSMYANCACSRHAETIFYEMNQGNVVSWTAMITAYTANEQLSAAIQLFQQMQSESIMPDNVVFLSVFDACANLRALAQGKRIHADLINSELEIDVMMRTAIMHMYGECASIEEAGKMANSMSSLDMVSWNAIIKAYAQNEHQREAIQLLRKMELDCVVLNTSNILNLIATYANLALLLPGHFHGCIGSGLEVTVCNALINMYAKCGCLENAQKTFDHMLEKNAVSWNCILFAYGLYGHGKEALDLLKRMHLGGIFPTDVTFVLILSACSHAGLVDEACHQFISMSRDYHITPMANHYACIIDLLVRAGWLLEANIFLNGMLFDLFSSRTLQMSTFKINSEDH